MTTYLPTQPPPVPMANYSGPTSLAKQLHGYPHYDFARHQVEVSPQSVIDHPRPYLESLGSIAALPMILFLIFVIFDIIVRLFFACRQPRIDAQSAAYKPKDYAICSKYQPYWDRKWGIAMLVSTLCIITVFIALGFLGSVNNDLNKTEDAMHDAQGYENAVLQDGYNAINLLNQASSILTSLGANENPPYSTIGQVSTSIQQTLVTVQQAVQVANLTLINYIGTSSNYRFASEIIKYTDTGRSDLRAVMITVFLLFFVTFLPLLIIRSFLPTKRTCLNIVQFFAIIACFVSWCAAMVMIAVSVGVADLCQDPNAYIRYYFRNQDQDVKNTIDYYITCPYNPNSNINPSPLYNLLSSGQQTTKSVDQTLGQVRRQFDLLPASLAKYTNLLHQIDSTNNQTYYLLGSVITDTNCVRLYDDYTIAVNTVCKDALSHWYGVAVCLAVSTILYLIVRCCIRSRQRIVSGDIEGNGDPRASVYNKVETPPNQHVIDMNQPQQVPRASMEMMIAPSTFEQPLAPAPTQTFQQPIVQPVPATTFQQPLEQPVTSSFQQPLAPPTYQQPLSSTPPPTYHPISSTPSLPKRPSLPSRTSYHHPNAPSTHSTLDAPLKGPAPVASAPPHDDSI